MINPLFSSLSPEHMPEDTMQYQMQIDPVHHNAVFPEQSPQILRIIIKVQSIRSHAVRTSIRYKWHARQCNVQETHLHIKLISCCDQDLSADRLHTFQHGS